MQYYTRKWGNDAWPGTDTQPKLTLKAGVGLLVGGDRLIVGDGIYNEALRDVMRNSVYIPSGVAGRPTIIQAENRRQAIIQTNDGEYGSIWISQTRHYVTFIGLRVDHAAHLGDDFGSINIGTGSGTDEIDHIIIQDCEVYNAKFGIGIGSHLRESSVHDCQIYGCECHHNDEYGIYLGGLNTLVDGVYLHNNDRVPTGQTGYNLHHYGNNGGADNHVIRNSRFDGSGACYKANVLIASGNDTQFYNNLVYGGIGEGIRGNYGAMRTLLMNNTVFDNAGPGVMALDGSIIGHNNILFRNGRDAFDSQGSGTVKESYSLLGIDPLFADSSNADFHIQRGSPAIAGGTNLSAYFKDDFYGAIRQGWDIGAAAFIGLPPPTPDPTQPPFHRRRYNRRQEDR